MAEVMNNLFGITPESLMAQREQALQTQAMQYAKLDPFQRATAGIYAGANKLGGAIGGMLGAQDPEMMRLTQRQTLLKQAQPQDAAGWKALAQQFYNAGDAPAAQEALAKSQALEAAALETRKTESIISKNTAEQRAAATPADIQKAQRIAAIRAALPAYKEAGDMTTYKLLEDELNALTPADKTPAFGAEAERLAKGKYGKPFSDLTQKEAAVVDAELEKRGLTKAQASANKPVDVASIIKEIGTKEDVKDKAKTWQAAGDAYRMQVPMIAKLQEVKEALPKTFTGSFSETALQFGKGLSAFGIPVDRNKLANTEYMNSVSSQVLQTIARNFPGSLAVKEMDQLVKSKFNSQQQIETISRILGDLQTEIEAGTKSYEQLAKLPETERYTKDLNYLTGQNFNKLKRYRTLEQKASSLSAGQKMSKQEVDEARKLQSELGVQ